MSAEHVAAMNASLADSREIAEATSQLDRAYTLMYRLHDAPGGGVAHWTLTFSRAGMRFDLQPTESADLVMDVDFAAMITASRLARSGENMAVDIEYTGDQSILEIIGPILAAGRSVATFEVDYPDVELASATGSAAAEAD